MKMCSVYVLRSLKTMEIKVNWNLMLFVIYLITIPQSGLSDVAVDPNFAGPIANVTVPVGREAMLTCIVHDIGSYKVAWLRVDTQTILTIQNHVITKNHRVSVTYSERKTWQLKIKDIKESDQGWYMCQINTDPMKSQVGYLDVVVPPDILDYPTSTDMVVRENSNVTLRCAATGSPEPTITWRREGGQKISLPNGEVSSVDGSTLELPRVNRLHMGSYLCIASNGVPPSVSKRVTLIVHFPPMMMVQNQLVGAYEGQRITIECQSEAYPKSINYWTREKGDTVPQGGKFETSLTDNAYRVVMKLTIKSVGPNDFGTYKCVARNSIGETDGTIKIYSLSTSNGNAIGGSNEKRPRGKSRKSGSNYSTNDIVDDDPETLSKRKESYQDDYQDENNHHFQIQSSGSRLYRWDYIGLLAVILIVWNLIAIAR